MANTQLTQSGVLNYIDGLLVNEVDLLNDSSDLNNKDGQAIAAILGQLNAIPNYNGITISPSGLVLTVGGNGGNGDPKMLVVQGRLCDYIPLQTFNTPTATGAIATRIDLLSVKFTSTSISGIIPNQLVQNSLGQNTSQSIGINFNGVTWTYTTGTPGGGTPATPTGYESYATITMAAGASSVVASQITYTFGRGAATLNSPSKQTGSLWIGGSLTFGADLASGRALVVGVDGTGITGAWANELSSGQQETIFGTGAGFHSVSAANNVFAIAQAASATNYWNFENGGIFRTAVGFISDMIGTDTFLTTPVSIAAVMRIGNQVAGSTQTLIGTGPGFGTLAASGNIFSIAAVGGASSAGLGPTGVWSALTGFTIAGTSGVGDNGYQFNNSVKMLAGAGAPSGTEAKGTIFLRTNGGVGTTLYVSQGAGTWNAVAGV